VVGLEESLFPNAMAVNSREDLEEERRLFYVAVTRAKKNLWLTYANSRYRFGNLMQNDPSRFLEEIPREYLEESFAGRNITNSGYRPVWESNRPARAAAKTTASVSGLAPVTRPGNTAFSHTPSENFKADDPATMEAGMEVEHQKFGFGRILRLEGNPNNRIATIVFEKAGEKKIMLNYAKLQIVNHTAE
jgi:DNA helicase-2/ATP-dependent DNA helicase PcrA